MNKQKWMVEWSSATGSGNDWFETPDFWIRSQVLRHWETKHPGCNVDKLTAAGQYYPEYYEG